MTRAAGCIILAGLACIVLSSPAYMQINEEGIAVDEMSDFEEGDILADNKAYMGQSSGKLKISLRDNARLWPGGNVPYSIFNREDEPNTYDLVKTAIKKMNSALDGCVNFYFEEDPEYEEDYVDIVLGDSLSSQLGHQRNGAQQLTITRESEQPQFGLNSGSIQHELMHSLGFGHEHNREDRDEYVKVLWDNLKKGEDETYFQKYPNPGNFSHDNLLPYDFNSIMHATAKIESLAINSYKPVIERLNTEGSLGQRDHLTELDIQRVKRTYSCDICDYNNEGQIFRYPGDCSQYYECVNGKPMVRPCPSGLHINPERQYCDYPSQAGCTDLEDLYV